MMPDIGGGDAGIKIDEIKQTFLFIYFYIVSRVPFKSGVLNYAYKMLKYVLFLFVK